MKICSICKIEKDIADFVIDKREKDLAGSRCKACDRDKRREYYKNNREKVLKYSISYKKKNPDDPVKFKARQKINREVRAGRVKRERCVICGEEKTQAHHEDYSKPLEVIWFCGRHHEEHHHKKII